MLLIGMEGELRASVHADAMHDHNEGDRAAEQARERHPPTPRCAWRAEKEAHCAQARIDPPHSKRPLTTVIPGCLSALATGGPLSTSWRESKPLMPGVPSQKELAAMASSIVYTGVTPGGGGP